MQFTLRNYPKKSNYNTYNCVTCRTSGNFSKTWFQNHEQNCQWEIFNISMSIWIRLGSILRSDFQDWITYIYVTSA